MAQSAPAFCFHLRYSFCFDALDKMSYLEVGRVNPKSEMMTTKRRKRGMVQCRKEVCVCR